MMRYQPTTGVLESTQSAAYALGVHDLQDLRDIAWDVDVVGNCDCPLTETEVGEVFDFCQPVGRPEENLDALKTALSAACEAAWAAGRS